MCVNVCMCVCQCMCVFGNMCEECSLQVYLFTEMGSVSIAQMKANSKRQMRKARKILAKKRNSLPAVSIPIISDLKLVFITTFFFLVILFDIHRCIYIL